VCGEEETYALPCSPHPAEQGEVKIIFLSRELENEIYMTQHDGFVIKGQEDKMCKTQKSLYDMKQIYMTQIVA
jgi:hypothetical protein